MQVARIGGCLHDVADAIVGVAPHHFPGFLGIVGTHGHAKGQHAFGHVAAVNRPPARIAVGQARGSGAKGFCTADQRACRLQADLDGALGDSFNRFNPGDYAVVPTCIGLVKGGLESPFGHGVRRTILCHGHAAEYGNDPGPHRGLQHSGMFHFFLLFHWAFTNRTKMIRRGFQSRRSAANKGSNVLK